MGYNLTYTLEILDMLNENGYIKGPVLDLGNQEFKNVTKDELKQFAMVNGYYNLLEKPTVKNLLRDRYGIENYCDIDINGGAEITANFCHEGEIKNYKNRFNTILDFGTLEHIFDQYSAFRNIYSICKPDGHLIHTLPYIQPDHGLFNYSMKVVTAIVKFNPNLLHWMLHGILIVDRDTNDYKIHIFKRNITKYDKMDIASEYMNTFKRTAIWHILCYRKKSNVPLNRFSIA